MILLLVQRRRGGSASQDSSAPFVCLVEDCKTLLKKQERKMPRLIDVKGSSEQQLGAENNEEKGSHVGAENVIAGKIGEPIGLW